MNVCAQTGFEHPYHIDGNFGRLEEIEFGRVATKGPSYVSRKILAAFSLFLRRK